MESSFQISPFHVLVLSLNVTLGALAVVCLPTKGFIVGLFSSTLDVTAATELRLEELLKESTRNPRILEAYYNDLRLISNARRAGVLLAIAVGLVLAYYLGIQGGSDSTAALVLAGLDLSLAACGIYLNHRRSKVSQILQYEI